MEKELIYLEENDDPIFEDGRIWMYLTDDDKVRALMDSNHTDYLAKYEDWFEMCSLKCYVTYCPKDESIKLVVHPIVFEEGDKTLVNELLKKYDKYDLETNEIALTEEEKTLITNQVKEYVERKGLLNAFKEYEDGLKTDSDYQFYFNCLKDDVNKMKQCETKQDLVDWLVDYIDNKGCRNILDVLDGKDKDYPSLEDWTEEFCFNEIAEWIEEARESDEETLTSDELWNVIEMFANEEYENGSEMLEEIKESKELKEDKVYWIEDDDPQFNEDCIDVYVCDTPEVRALMDTDKVNYFEDFLGKDCDLYAVNFYANYYPDTDDIILQVCVSYEAEIEKEINLALDSFDKLNKNKVGDYFDYFVNLTDKEKEVLKSEVKEWLNERNLISEWREYKEEEKDDR